MPMLRFTSKDQATEIEIRVAGGSELLAIQRKNPELPLKFGCCHGECGTCAIEVLQGSQNLSKCSQQELLTLKKKGLSGNHRLACQCALNGDVTIARP